MQTVLTWVDNICNTVVFRVNELPTSNCNYYIASGQASYDVRKAQGGYLGGR